jgi:DnaK suppressor protein
MLEELRTTHTVQLSHIDGAVIAASFQAGEEHLTWTQLTSSHRLLDEIDDALKRIDNDEYGDCEECGSSIAPERLETIPYARRCVRC